MIYKTVRDTSKRAGITKQPKVSDLLRGRLAGFSMERLIRFLNSLDHDVEIVVKQKCRGRKQGQVSVMAA